MMPAETRKAPGRVISILQIVGLSIAGAVLYGEVHDQVTAHINVEYFTIGHPRVIESESPVLLAIVWGFIATWWMGLILGMVLATVAQTGSWPRISARQLVRPMAWALGATGIAAAFTGLVEWLVPGMFWLLTGDVIPDEVANYNSYQTAHAMHIVSYLAGTIAGIVLIIRTLRRRWRLHRSPAP